MKEQFEMVAKTFQGLEEVLAEELRNLGAKNVEPARRAVSFEGDLETLYKANLCCRTALRILKPIYKFEAHDPDELYERVKEWDWSQLMSADNSFAVDVTAYSEEITHSRYATYRVKDAIVDYFTDRFGDDVRPKVRVTEPDFLINVHISGDRVTLSLDSSGESLHKRGYRVAQTDAPINEVLAAGIILRSGWRGDSPFVDPMCGSGTFLIEAALIANNINPGVYRQGFAFERWPNFDKELFESIYNDDSAEREFEYKIYGSDIDPKAIQITRQNIKSAGLGRFIEVELKDIADWNEAPEKGVLITNPPYGERLSVMDMEGLYETIGRKLKHVFTGYHAWIIGYRDEYFHKIGLAPSAKIPMLNGSLECQLREYVIFDGDYKSFRADGGRLKEVEDHKERRAERDEDFRKRAREQRSFGRDRRDRGDRGDRGGRRNSFEGIREKFATRAERQDARRARFAATGAVDEGPRPSKFRGEKQERGARPERGESRFDRSGRSGKFDRSGRPGKFDKFDRSGKPGRGRDDNDFGRLTAYEPDPENPFAMRRNVHALKSITGRKPTIEGPRMRGRRGSKPTEGDAD